MVIGNWQDMERKKRKSFLEQNQDNGAILRSSSVGSKPMGVGERWSF
jgi:hypothetical protein